MTKSKIISLVAVTFLFAFAAHAWAYQTPQEYDQTVPEWMRTFYHGDLDGPEYRGPWVYGINRLSMDKGVDEGFIPKSAWASTYRSRGDGHKTDFWVADSKQVAGLSFSNDIAKWLEPPEGMTRSIRFSILQDYSGGGGPNNTDIMEIDEYQVETLIKHGYKNGPPPVPPYDTLGYDDPWAGQDSDISAFDFKADLAAHRGFYDHANSINSTYYRGLPMWSAGQSGEDIYFSAGKTGQFDGTTHMLNYGKRVNSTWGSGSGSGYGTLGNAKFDTMGAQSGEAFGRYAYYSNSRWWNYVVIADTTYWLYLQNSDGTIRDYNASIYPEDSANPGDPESASGHPIRWHDDYELELTHGLDLGVDTYGTAGRWVVERASTTYWAAGQSHAHVGDVMSELRTYDPIMNGNSDGPESQYDWIYDTSGDMHEPNWYYDGVTRTAYAGEWDADTPYERAEHLIGVKGSWTEQTDKLPANGGTPPDGEHNWEYRGTTERREIELPNGPPDTYWDWTGTTGVLQVANPYNPPSLELPDGVIWYWTNPGQHPYYAIWETHDEAIPEDTREVTDWRAPEYNWRTYNGYSGADQHPDYPDDDHFSSWYEWEWDATTETWSSAYTNVNDMETDDYALGKNGGGVSKQYFVYAWKIAGKLLGDRFWEDGYVWSNELGAVATRELVEDDFVETMPTYSLRLPTMVWNATLNRWDFPTSVYASGYLSPWSFQDHYVDHAVAGHDELNLFLRYVMDIDALVIQDVNGDGVYDEEEDYILFSLVDDGLFTKMLYWGAYSGAGVDTPFDGEYFDGETIFLYHNCNVTTYFDPNTGVFFGLPIGTTPGSTLWGSLGVYDLNALDIGLVPEPTTIILIVGAALAASAGIVRRKLRK